MLRLVRSESPGGLALLAGDWQQPVDVMPDPRTWHARYEWHLETMVDAGTVKLLDGWLSGGDPWWSREGVSFELRLPPGAYPVRVAVAVAEGEARRGASARGPTHRRRPRRPDTVGLVPTLAFNPRWRLLERARRHVLRSNRLARDRSNVGARPIPRPNTQAGTSSMTTMATTNSASCSSRSGPSTGSA